MAISPAALKAEIQNDPTARGYAVPYAAGNDQAVADLLNAPRAGATVNRTLVPAWEFVNAMVASEVNAIPTAAREYLLLVASANEVQLGGGGVRNALTVIFGAGTTTRANLIALLTKPATRSEELSGLGAIISAADVSAARRA